MYESSAGQRACAEWDAERARLEASLSTARAEAALQRLELERMRASRSWRITAPVRSALRGFGEARSWLNRQWRPASSNLVWSRDAISSFERQAVTSCNRASHQIGQLNPAPPGDGGKAFSPTVVFHSHDLSWTGAPNSLFEIAAGIGRRGSYHSIVLADKDGPLRDSYIAEGLDVGLCGFQQDGGCGADEFNRQVDTLASTYSRLGARLVHANSILAFPAVLAARRAGLGALWNIRESLDPERCFDYLRPSVRTLAYEAFSSANWIAFVAESTRQLWRPVLGHRRHSVITTGIELSRLMRRTYGTDRKQARLAMGFGSDDVVLLSVGTVCERKGQSDLVQMLKHIPDSLMRRLIVVVIGFSDSLYAARVRSGLAAYEASGLRVRLLDATTDEKGFKVISHHFLAADMFVLSSRVESYPRVILEAMALGAPIITTPCFGVAQQVVDGESALFYPFGDAQTLARHVVCLDCDKALRGRLARNARSHLDTLNSYDNMLDSYERIYASISAEYNG